MGESINSRAPRYRRRRCTAFKRIIPAKNEHIQLVSVTRFGKISPIMAKFQSFWAILWGFISYLAILWTNLAKNYTFSIFWLLLMAKIWDII